MTPDVTLAYLPESSHGPRPYDSYSVHLLQKNRSAALHSFGYRSWPAIFWSSWIKTFKTSPVDSPIPWAHEPPQPNTTPGTSTPKKRRGYSRQHDGWPAPAPSWRTILRRYPQKSPYSPIDGTIRTFLSPSPTRCWSSPTLPRAQRVKSRQHASWIGYT